MKSPQNTKRIFDLKTTTSFVVANMIGVGVYTSLGFQLESAYSAFAVMSLWLLGGVTAFLGALSYIALAHVLPRSGGEYNFLSRIYGSAAGFIAGFITVVVGFAAPIAAAALAFGAYLQHVVPVPPLASAVTGILLITAIHLYDTEEGGRFHYLTTLLKIILIVVFIAAAFFVDYSPQAVSLWPISSDWTLMTTSGFAVSFVYVTYSYTGWNAAVYVLDEVEQPKRTVPLAILFGTALVTLLYFCLNYVFLYTAPMSALKGQEEVAQVAADYMFGTKGAAIMSGLIAAGLISAISSMIVTGSRVVKVMAEDYTALSFLNKTNRRRSPYAALLLTAGLALIFACSASLQGIVTYAGFVFTLFGIMTVGGLFVLKYKNKALNLPYGKWFFPFIPLLFLIIKCWVAVFLLTDKTEESLLGLLTILLGGLVYRGLREGRGV